MSSGSEDENVAETDRNMNQGRSLFEPVVSPERLNPSFKSVSEVRGRLPARTALQRAFELLPAPDKNFIKDFQSTGFDARVWELYLAALSADLKLSIKQPCHRPDFLLNRGGESIWVEATTANATEGVVAPHPDDYWDERDYIAAKLGSPLYSKLNKRYWELPHVRGMPLVLAIADFHDPDPVRPSFDPLQCYLYGVHARLDSSAAAARSYHLHPLDSLGAKNVPAGFFSLPEAQHISAVLFSNAGTVAKFSRMGFDRNIHTNIRILRFGFSFNPEPTAIVPEPFAYIVGDAPETWGQEGVVCHNPNALHPVSQEFFGPLSQFWLIDNIYWYTVADFFPYFSTTQIIEGASTLMPKDGQHVRI